MTRISRFALFLFSAFLCEITTSAQTQIFDSTIKSVKLFRPGNQTSFPVMQLNGTDQLQLEFDDLGTRVKTYYYSFQLCNADWSPSILNSFDYTRGFQSTRITTYRNSAIAFTRYVHYQATFPDRNSAPTRSGNYLLKVFLNNDTTQLAFTKRFVVVNTLAQVGAQVQQPYNAQLFQTGQRLKLAIQIDKRINVLNQSDLKVAILQNQNWQTALFINQPTIWRANYFEYNDEGNTVLEAGREFRWVDMRSLRLLGDRMAKLDNSKDLVQVWVKTETTRRGQPFIYYNDLNGGYTIETFENINPYWESDYALTHFTFVPPNGRPIEGSNVYLFGEMTNYASDTTGLMHFNKETGAYEKSLFLKQGYYNYLYATRPVDGGPIDFGQTEGNNWSTENNYTVLVYYRPFGARVDECIGFATFNSVLHR